MFQQISYQRKLLLFEIEISYNARLHAPVAQLDRVPGFEPGGREFESLRARN